MAYRTGVPHFGVTGKPETMNETSLPNARQLVGIVYERGSKRWQIAQIVDAANAAIGDLVYWKSYASYTVTPTIGNSSQNEPAGVMEVIASAANNFVAVRQGGVMSVKSADATINARGLRVISDTSANRVILQAADTNAAQTKITVVGIAQAAQAGGFVSTYLTLNPI